MTCPSCNGDGRFRERFLFFFWLWRECETCYGTGVVCERSPAQEPVPISPVQATPPQRVPRGPGKKIPVRRWRDDSDAADFHLFPDVHWGSTSFPPVLLPIAEVAPPIPAEFEGSGGASGGGGATGSWDAPPLEQDLPLIVDPFPQEASCTPAEAVSDGNATESGQEYVSCSAPDDAPSSESIGSDYSATQY